MDCIMPGFPVHHQLPKLAQTHVHQVGDAIQPSHPLLSPSPPAFNLFLKSGKDWGQEEKGTTEDEMVGWHHWLSGHEFEQAWGVGDEQGSLACCWPWGLKELNMTEQLNWTELKLTGQRIGVSASASVLLMNIQDWFPLGWTGWISLQSKGLSRVFSNTTIQKHQFFGAQLSL